MSIRVLVLTALLCASSAASAKQYAPPMPLAPQLPVEVYLGQHEVEIEVPQQGSAMAGAMVGGLIGGLISASMDAAAVRSAERRAAVLRNLLVDYDFNARFERALRAKLATADGISPAVELHALGNAPNVMVGFTSVALVAPPGEPEPALGLVASVAPRYALSNNLSDLHVTLGFALAERTRTAKGKIRPNYLMNRQYRFEITLEPNVGGNADTNLARWQRVGPQRLQHALDTAVEQLTDMLVYDYSVEGRAEGARKVGKEFTQFQEFRMGGRSLRSGEDWYWLRPPADFAIAIRGMFPMRDAVDAAPVGAGAP